MRALAAQRAYVFRVELRTQSQPRVWREIRVPTNIPFNKFHKVLQIAFGWEDRHMYTFEVVDAKNRDPFKDPYITIANRDFVWTAQDMGPDNHGELITSTAILPRLFDNKNVPPMSEFYECIYEYDDYKHKVELLGQADIDLDSRTLDQGVGLGQACFCTDGEGYGVIDGYRHQEAWEESKWRLTDRGEHDPWHCDLVRINRRLDHMWLTMGESQERQFWRELLRGENQHWVQTRDTAQMASEERLETFKQDPGMLQQYREPIRWR